MGIIVGTNFDLSAALPLDSKIVSDTLVTRDAIDNKYEGLVVFVKSDQKNYQLKGGVTNADWYPLSADVDLSAYYTSAQTNSAISTAISNLVNTAPGTLDTLNELAIALGNDPNFATTMTTLIGTKLSGTDPRIVNWNTAYGWGNHTGLYSLLGHNHSGVYEPVLGNPGTSGYILSSTSAGVRSWVVQSTGITITPTPASTQVAVWSGASTIYGSNAFTFDGSYVRTIYSTKRSSIGQGQFISDISGIDKMVFDPYVADGATALPYIFNTSVPLTVAGAKIVSIRNNDVEKFSIDKDGNVNIPVGSTYRINGTSITLGFAPLESPIFTGTVTVNGNRPITFSSGAAYIKGEAGGWGIAYGFKGSAGLDFGGFGAFGDTNALTNLFIGRAYNDQGVKVFLDGATELYYDNVKKLETTSTGISIKRLTTSDRTTVTRILELEHQSTANPYTGFGTGIIFKATDYSNTMRDYAAIDTIMESFNNATPPDSGFESGLQFYTNYRGSFTEKVRIKGSGNVGFGTTAPSYRLDILGSGGTGFNSLGTATVRITPDSVNTYACVELRTYNAGAYGGAGILAVNIQNNDAELAFFYTPPSSTTRTEGMRLKNNGNFGIACSAATRLHSYSTGTNEFRNEATGSSVVRLISGDGYASYFQWNSTGDSNFYLYDTYHGAIRMTIDHAGAITAGNTITATNFILSSDRRLKTNIAAIDRLPIDIEYKSFELISEPGQKRYGVVAQDLQAKNPELVRTDAKGMLSVAYTDLLIKEIAYLKHKVAELERRIV